MINLIDIKVYLPVPERAWGARAVNPGRWHAAGAQWLPLLYLILLLSLPLVYAGCTSLNTFSDNEAVKLVKSFYLFSRDGRAVEARVIHRGEYSGDCKCYPVTFDINSNGRQNISKTFYLFQNKSGAFDIKEYRKILTQ